MSSSLYKLIQYMDVHLHNDGNHNLSLLIIVNASEVILAIDELTPPQPPTVTGRGTLGIASPDHEVGQIERRLRYILTFSDDIYIQRNDDGKVGIKITISVSSGGNAAFSRFQDQIRNLPTGVIVFSQRFGKVVIHKEFGPKYSLTFKKMLHATDPGFVMIDRVYQERERNAPKRETRDYGYYVHCSSLSDMPTEQSRPAVTTAKVQLAFPVHSTAKKPAPSKTGRLLFSHTSWERMPQFQFLVHSDFIISPNGNGLATCNWNQVICSGVADAFCDEIGRLIVNDNIALRYSWLDYLPKSPIEGLWSKFHSTIMNKLGNKKILQTWEERRQFKCPSSLERVIPLAIHEGNPILKDFHETTYLAPEYAKKHHHALKALGVKGMSWGTLIDRLKEDLSRLGKTPANDPWHEAFANLFIRVLQNPDCEADREELRELNIIPLNDGIWTSAFQVGPDGPDDVYFPFTDGVAIPHDISLSLLERDAATNPKRNEFYKALGVKGLSASTVLCRIEITHRRLHEEIPVHSLKRDINDVNSVELVPDYSTHFAYLFRFGPLPGRILSWLWVPTTAALDIQCASENLYFLSDGEYDTAQLLPRSFQDSANDVVKFIKPSVVDLKPPFTRNDNCSYMDWLRKATGARHYPPLVTYPENGSAMLSRVLLAVLKHSPQKFVSMLKVHWSEYKQDVTLSEVRAQLQKCKVPCESEEMIELERTYLPTPTIREALKQLSGASWIDLLKLPDVSHRNEPLLGDNGVQEPPHMTLARMSITPTTSHLSNMEDWYFLKELGVHTEPDLEFYKRILEGQLNKGTLTTESINTIRSHAKETIHASDKEHIAVYSEKFLSQITPRNSSIHVPYIPIPFSNRPSPPKRDWSTSPFLAMIDQVRYSAHNAAALYTKTDAPNAQTILYPDMGFSYFDDLESLLKAALGEAYVFELFSHLNLPAFTPEGFIARDWISGIRRFLATHEIYAGRGLTDLPNFPRGKMKYTDDNGALTTYIKQHCAETGGFPDRLSDPTAALPIEYWFEIRSTPGGRTTPFTLNEEQYHCMREDNELIGHNRMVRSGRRVYVLLHVYNLGLKAKMDIYVEPRRLDDLIRWEYRTIQNRRTGQEKKSWMGVPQMARLGEAK
ncbi:hypothetical protein P154DRAFT_316257 [Amniculicola lignicola CBS 123094]|uniref:Uncharacterized protein n=1 Tax=Amniculicola lignicola CBS 123094 TaxID=1392246 RepID=A0A6A5WY35_9PLEO|nr:hypothetical protein P154DRAFT_316257 [Amniculicola lignicola CBS 123094]